MSISVICDCGKGYRVPDHVAGKKMKCKSCGTAISVPREDDNDFGLDELNLDAFPDQDVDNDLPPRRPKSKGNRKSAKHESDVSVGGLLTGGVRKIFGVLAILVGVAILGGIIFTLVNGDGVRKVGGGFVMCGVFISVGYRWLTT